MKYGGQGAITLDVTYLPLKLKTKLTIIYSSSIDTVSLMFLEPFDWDHMTSIIFAVSHFFSYLWIFLKEKKLLLNAYYTMPVFDPPFPSGNT